MFIFGSCSQTTGKWKQTFNQRNSMERINTSLGRDFLLDDHFLRGKSTMHLLIAGSMVVMLAIALGYLKDQARQDARPGNTAGYLKHSCYLGLDHADRVGRYRHVRNSKVDEISPFRVKKILGQSYKLANQNIFILQPTLENQ